MSESHHMAAHITHVLLLYICIPSIRLLSPTVTPKKKKDGFISKAFFLMSSLWQCLLLNEVTCSWLAVQATKTQEDSGVWLFYLVLVKIMHSFVLPVGAVNFVNHSVDVWYGQSIVFVVFGLLSLKDILKSIWKKWIPLRHPAWCIV